MHNHTFVVITLIVDETTRFNRYEVAEVLRPQLQGHKAVMVELTEEILPLANIARLTAEVPRAGERSATYSPSARTCSGSGGRALAVS